MYRCIILCLICILGPSIINCESNSKCITQETCGECIQIPDCLWCSSIIVENGTHCFNNNINLTEVCNNYNSDYIENPENIQNSTDDHDHTSQNSDTPPEEIVQLKPQKIKLKLRKGYPHNVTVSYRRARDFPIDLYYLMDLSNSMKDDKEALASLGNKIADVLMNHTKQLRLGFGSFVDKPTLPFSDMSPGKLDTPCNGCKRTFIFRNDLPLTNDTKSFVSKIDKTVMSGNRDTAEGGLEALMQVIKCKEHIDWDEHARRIIIVSTDAKFHLAGNGKLAALVHPNEEKCYLKELDNSHDDLKSYSLKHDYPSIGQINKVAKEKGISIIFAVSNYEELYEKLTNFIERSTHGMLNTNSKNVVDLVEKQYLEISSKVELKDNSYNFAQIKVQYFAKCPGNETRETSTCENIREGDEIEFTINITAKECLTDSKPFELVAKTSQENITIDIDIICDCSCESSTHSLYEPNSQKCNGKGSLACGICDCNESVNGKNCICDETDNTNCKATEDSEECSDNGKCMCNKCDCNDGYDGKFCQCNSKSCMREDNIECSGHGNCTCNVCECEHGWDGIFCECRNDSYCERPDDDSYCERPDDDKICSGKGECKCGKCHCNADGGFFGDFCEDCPTCCEGKCKEFKDTVKFCTFSYVSKNDEEYKRRNCSKIKYSEDMLIGIQSNKLCKFIDEEDRCAFNFTYKYERKTDSYIIYASTEKICPKMPNVLGVLIGVITCIVFVGLITLVMWKIFTTYKDRREFAHFEEEQGNSEWKDALNPIYNDPNREFKNPCFNEGGI